MPSVGLVMVKLALAVALALAAAELALAFVLEVLPVVALDAFCAARCWLEFAFLRELLEVLLIRPTPCPPSYVPAM